jgi:hypothetical protein
MSGSNFFCKGKIPRTKRIACVLLLLSGLGSLLCAQTRDAKSVIDGWYERNQRAEAYGNMRKDLVGIITRVQAVSLPDELFLEILDEGVAKRISATALLDTLKTRFGEYLAIRTMLESVHPCLEKKIPLDEYVSPVVLKKYSLFLRQGLSERICREMLDEACARGERYEHVVNVLRTLSSIPSRAELSEGELVTLGKAILGSTLSPTSYTALSSMYIKGKLKNLSIHDMTAIFISVLKEGKGLVRIEQELSRRSGL